MDDRCTTCGNARCHLDADDWCRAHGWACADHHHNPGLLVGVLAQAAGGRPGRVRSRWPQFSGTPALTHESTDPPSCRPKE